MMQKKLKTRTIDGKALYAQAGIYELVEPIPSPLVPNGEWPVGTRFIVERHIDKIGDQLAYEHFSLRLIDNHKYLVKSYQHSNWNGAISRLRFVK
jgi:hypothetical protein